VILRASSVLRMVTAMLMSFCMAGTQNFGKLRTDQRFRTLQSFVFSVDFHINCAQKA